MLRILVLISLSADGIKIIKANPEIPKKEMEFVNQWKDENFLENFYISVSKNEAILVFKNKDEHEVKQMIETLPYFPYMEKIDYHVLNKQF